jgi:hypothetical protein
VLQQPLAQPLVQPLLQQPVLQPLWQQVFFVLNRLNRLKQQPEWQPQLEPQPQELWQPQAGSQAVAQPQAGSQAVAQPQAGSQQLLQPLLQQLLQQPESNKPIKPWKMSGVRQQYCWQGVQHCCWQPVLQPQAGSQADGQPQAGSQADGQPQAGSQQLCWQQLPPWTPSMRSSRS